eukprot:g1637.t1
MLRRVEIMVPIQNVGETRKYIAEGLSIFKNNAHPPLSVEVFSKDSSVGVFHVTLHCSDVGQFIHHLDKHGVGIIFGIITIFDAKVHVPLLPPRYCGTGFERIYDAFMSEEGESPMTSLASDETDLERKDEPQSSKKPHRHDEHFTFVLSWALERLQHGLPVHWMEEYGVDKRMSVEELHAVVCRGNDANFDFWLSVLCSILIVCAGLSTNDEVMIVAAMLISPLIGPMVAIIFGFATDDRDLVRKGIRNELSAIFVSWIFSFLIGLLLTPLAEDLHWPTRSMEDRATTGKLVVSSIVAAVTGIVVGCSITSGGVHSLIGIAISASLLPPLANSGMLFAFAITGGSNLTEVPKIWGKCHHWQKTLERCNLASLPVNVVEEVPYGINTSLIIEEAILSLLCFIIQIVIISATLALTFQIKHLYPDPYNKLGHQWTHPNNHRHQINRKKEMIKQHIKERITGLAAGDSLQSPKPLLRHRGSGSTMIDEEECLSDEVNFSTSVSLSSLQDDLQVDVIDVLEPVIELKSFDEVK